MGVWVLLEGIHHNVPSNIITACNYVIPRSTEKYQPGFDQKKHLQEELLAIRIITSQKEIRFFF